MRRDKLLLRDILNWIDSKGFEKGIHKETIRQRVLNSLMDTSEDKTAALPPLIALIEQYREWQHRKEKEWIVLGELIEWLQHMMSPSGEACPKFEPNKQCEMMEDSQWVCGTSACILKGSKKA